MSAPRRGLRLASERIRSLRKSGTTTARIPTRARRPILSHQQATRGGIVTHYTSFNNPDPRSNGSVDTANERTNPLWQRDISHSRGTNRSNAGDGQTVDNVPRSSSPPTTPIEKNKGRVKIVKSDVRSRDMFIERKLTEMLQIPILGLQLHVGGKDSKLVHDCSQSFGKKFERHLRSTSSTGLFSVCHAARYLSSNYPGLAIDLTLHGRRPAGYTPSTNDNISLKLRADDAHDLSGLSYLLTPFHNVKISLAHQQTPSTIQQMAIHLTLRSSNRWEEAPAADIPVMEELDLLHKRATAVMRKLVEEMTFPSLQSFSDLIAEGLLRAINPPDSRLELYRVSVTIDSPSHSGGITKMHTTAMIEGTVFAEDGHSNGSQSESSTTIVSSSRGATETTPIVPQREKGTETDQSGSARHSKDRSSASDHTTSDSKQFIGSSQAEQKPPASSVQPSLCSKGQGRVYIALGSNMGDRLENIEKACNMIDADPDMKILQTSCLYETDPMYVQNQNRFLNGACEISTTLQPLQLLDRLQAIETKLDRVKVIDKGPRTIDLDILMYRGQSLQSERLTIPHPLIHERDFVIRPMADLATARHIMVPGTNASFPVLASKAADSAEAASRLTPLAPKLQLLRKGRARQTLIMSILNTTPDSFSDGGCNEPTDRLGLYQTIRSHALAGASIIDVGGQSSRPKAPDVTAEEELARILPAIEAIKSCPEASHVAISVDTYRAAVAEAAVKAGAHIVNDISAGQMDPAMLSTVARLGCTYVMMHMRGTPATMQSQENCTYSNGVRWTIWKELKSRVDAARSSGIRSWRIIIDPGIGFSKTQQQNLTLLRSMGAGRDGLHIYPLLLGSSRKSFIGSITGVAEPKDRSWGTAATVTAAIHGSADIVRVHDVKEMAAVVKMADAIYAADVNL